MRPQTILLITCGTSLAMPTYTFQGCIDIKSDISHSLYPSGSPTTTQRQTIGCKVDGSSNSGGNNLLSGTICLKTRIEPVGDAISTPQSDGEDGGCLGEGPGRGRLRERPGLPRL